MNRRSRRHPVAAGCGLILVLAGLLTAGAEEPSPYEAVGAPSHPRVPAQWNRYHDFEQATRLLKQLAEVHRGRARLTSVGKSHGGRELWVLTVTNFRSAPVTEKPAFWIDGGIHANEIQSVEVVLYTAWYLLESWSRNPTVRRLLDEQVFHLAPMLSPDSRDAHFYRPNSTHTPRTGPRPRDDDRDGRIDEDGPDDLDGDGHLTQMRVKDDQGRYVPHEDYPDLLVPVKPGRKGQYTLLGQEGFDNDGDGQVNEDGDGWYDPNRNWGWNWQPAYVQGGADRYPFSIPENRAVADFIMQHPEIGGAQSFHNAGGMILRGPGAKNDRYEPADVRVLDELAAKGRQMLPRYKYLEIATELYEVYGGELDWLYQTQGVFALTNEMFPDFNYFGDQTNGQHLGTPEAQHEFNKYLLLGEGLVAWKAVDHPQYGRIEVGGLKKTWVRQPPSFMLEEECHRNMAFTLYHADQLPLVRVRSIEVKPLDGELRQVTAVIANDRLCPTHAAVDVARKITPPDRVSIQAPQGRVLVGWQSSEPYFLKPIEQERRPAELRVASVPGRGAVYVRWLIEGSGPLQVTVRSVKGGAHERSWKPAEKR